MIITTRMPADRHSAHRRRHLARSGSASPTRPASTRRRNRAAKPASCRRRWRRGRRPGHAGLRRPSRRPLRQRCKVDRLHPAKSGDRFRERPWRRFATQTYCGSGEITHNTDSQTTARYSMHCAWNVFGSMGADTSVRAFESNETAAHSFRTGYAGRSHFGDAQVVTGLHVRRCYEMCKRRNCVLRKCKWGTIDIRETRRNATPGFYFSCCDQLGKSSSRSQP